MEMNGRSIQEAVAASPTAFAIARVLARTELAYPDGSGEPEDHWCDPPVLETTEAIVDALAEIEPRAPEASPTSYTTTVGTPIEVPGFLSSGTLTDLVGPRSTEQQEAYQRELADINEAERHAHVRARGIVLGSIPSNRVLAWVRDKRTGLKG